jgi:endo-1,4-beta-D-glucanase Y
MKSKSVSVNIARSLLLAAALPFMAGPALGASQCAWPAWENYKQQMISADGRVIDASSPQQVTTSEGQSYGLFFALVANDPQSFERLLSWTRDNLASGAFDRHLPAWQWGLNKDGQWRVLDSNNASDADLWIAYSLLEAGRLWRRPDYLALGQHLLWRSAAQSLRMLPGLGLMILPGDVGFESAQGWRLNPSYVPPQLLARFALIAPIWAEVAENSRRLLLEGAPKGFAADWLMWQAGQGFVADAKSAIGSYDAIRVYLWLGMLAPDARERTVLLDHFKPMLEATARLGHVPEQVDSQSGEAMGTGPVSFSAALLPLLASDPSASAALAAQRERLRQSPPLADAYYNQSLVMFGQGWDEQRYRFDKDGRLQPNWTPPCTQ